MRVHKLHIYKHLNEHNEVVTLCNKTGVPIALAAKPTCKECITNKLEA